MAVDDGLIDDRCWVMGSMWRYLCYWCRLFPEASSCSALSCWLLVSSLLLTSPVIVSFLPPGELAVCIGVFSLLCAYFVGSMPVHYIDALAFLSPSKMDRNAMRRKKYAEMSPTKKADLLRSRKEARAAKRDEKPLPVRVRKVPLGYVESGVSLPNARCMPCHGADQTFVHSQSLGNTDVVFPADNVLATGEGLEFMSGQLSSPFGSSSSSSFNRTIPVHKPPPAAADIPFLVPLKSNLPLFVTADLPFHHSLASVKYQRSSNGADPTKIPVHSTDCQVSAGSSKGVPKNILPLSPENEHFMNNEHSEIMLGLFSLNSTLINSEQPVQKHLPCESNSFSTPFSDSVLPPPGTGIIPGKKRNAPGTVANQKSAIERTPSSSYLSRIANIPSSSLVLPDAPDCEHCGAKRFHLEPPTFCCSGGEISIVAPPMPYDLKRLFIGNDEESAHFRNNVRTYNNNLGFTTFAAKYDSDLTKNTKGVYTFRVQGQVYHFLDGLIHLGDRPSGIQLYFFDTDEELAKRLGNSDKLREHTLRLLMRVLSNNPYTRFFKSLKDVPNIDNLNIVLNCYPSLDQRVYNLPSASQVAAIWTESEDQSSDRRAHIRVYSRSAGSHRIQHYYGCYDPLQYPLLFPRGECGWHHGIKRLHKRKRGGDSCESDITLDPASVSSSSELIDLEQRAADRGKTEADTVSVREYYCYRFQIRDTDESMLLHTLRLLQQFSVDGYVKIETSRLDFHRHRQNKIRSEILQGVLDSVSIGQTAGSKVGRKVILPGSFIGGPRDMRRRYLDAMALVQKYEKSDIFLTMTCNPAWKEIQENLKYHEKPQDRPDLLARVFRSKFEMLKAEILNRQIFGEVAACVYVIEFQKRGFPHAHLLLILKPGHKLLNPESYDKIVCAELPDKDRYPHLYSLVIKHMIHGPCGAMDKSCPCMRDGTCKNRYPKNFCAQTTHGEDTYPYYRRRDDGKSIKIHRFTLDNRWVVPYNPYLLALFDCHINVEICSTLKLVKYLYKYVFKGHDLVSFKIISCESVNDIDEIRDFQKGRWVSPPEAFWRIYEFKLNEMTPAVYTLQVHLPDQQLVSFDKNSDLLQLLNKVDFSKTMLTQFFHMNRTNHRAQTLKCFYRDFPEHFVWSPKYKEWTERKRRKVIGRMVTVSPKEGERYYLRLLLTHIAGPTSFEALLSINGQRLASFRESALALGLLQSDAYIEDTLREAVAFQMPSSLRLLFATLLVYCSPTNPRLLWDSFELDLSADYHHQQPFHGLSSLEIKRKVLQDINSSLEQMSKSLAEFHFVSNEFTSSYAERLTKEIESEKSLPVNPEDLLLSHKLNPEQKHAYDLILRACFSLQGQAFFIDGPGGTGKTFLYRSLLATLRSQNHVAIAMATSGIAASILPGGRTAHSRFKIPLDFSKTKTFWSFESTLILWDEASMAKRETIEAFDELLKDLMDSDLPFGGKVVVFGGDFRQTLPIIEQATKEVLIELTFLVSPLWSKLHKIRLTKNMRAMLDPGFSQFLLRVGEGTEPVDDRGEITLSPDIVIPYVDKEVSLNRLIESVFPDLDFYTHDPYNLINRCILAPKNSSVDELNEMMIRKFPGNLQTYISSDKTVDQRHQSDYEDFLNSQNPKGLPPHKLLLKKNCPIMLLRNLNPAEGLCNGTRLICRDLAQHTISAEIVFGHHRGKTVFIPRIPLQSPDNDKNGIPFMRTQFPVRLCFALTINKSQGQTLDYVGIYLREPVFSHGQLYVALSRAKTAAKVRILLVPGTFEGTKIDCKTRNVVFHEIFRLTQE
ncbi:uncharacterized protein [Coffea arabica]|uniref:ATP-dependent DNA helicase n=1 Tax=Coffea arabica TaxID=13443 RepID=A0A6P6TZ92_COFAR